ncbi:MAG: hypothetical protein KF812_05445 [Fimbriimonadaceae bacterium]|nr:hypothetical protein [Fimbriimonadaceae bacterium]
MAKKTWREKFENGKPPTLITMDKAAMGMQPGDKMLISSPEEIDQYIRTIPFGKTVTMVQMRDDLATRHGAVVCCPLTAGIFTRIVAECSLESGEDGNDATPFWRIVDPKSPLAKKLSCGPEWISKKRDEEAAA